MSLWTCEFLCTVRQCIVYFVHSLFLTPRTSRLAITVPCSPKPSLVLHGILRRALSLRCLPRNHIQFFGNIFSLSFFTRSSRLNYNWRWCICCYEWKAFIFLCDTLCDYENLVYRLHTVHPELQTVTRRKMRFCILPFSLHEQYEAVYPVQPRRVYEVCMDQLEVEKVEIYSLLNWISVCCVCGSVNWYCISSATQSAKS